MDEALLGVFQDAILARFGARSLLLRRERVAVERPGGGGASKVEVLVFALQGHPVARRCYAWEMGGKVRAVLHEPPIDSPEAAVRAAIAEPGPD